MVYKKLSSIFLAVGLCCSFEHGYVHAQQEESLATSALTSAVLVGSVVAVGMSSAYSLDNLRSHNAMLQKIEATYGLVPVYDWYQLPGHYLVQAICGKDDIVADIKINQCIDIIKSKVAKKNHTQDLFDFRLFIKQLPHVDMKGLYCIATSYFNDFNCTTLGQLKSVIESSLDMVEQNFKTLKKELTSLSNKDLLPGTFDEFYTFKINVLSGVQRPILNSSLGFFGYSALHNGERVKTCIIATAKYHAYLRLLQELFVACTDDDATILQHGAGVLHFTLQHDNYNQSVKIN